MKRIADPDLLIDVSTPTAATSVKLLGGRRSEGVCFSQDEVDSLCNLYEVDLAALSNILIDAGMWRDVVRSTQHDGMRVMAVLARFLEPKQDPVKLILQLMAEAGYDVDDHDWAYDEEESTLTDEKVTQNNLTEDQKVPVKQHPNGDRDDESDP